MPTGPLLLSGVTHRRLTLPPTRDKSSQPHRAGMGKLGEDRPLLEGPQPFGGGRGRSKSQRVHASGQRGRETA